MILEYVFLFILGLLFGSFLNAWVWRVREGQSVWKGRSMCPKCKKQLAWYDNIPVLSFILLKAKCRQCAKFISWQYPLVELWMGFIFFFTLYYHQSFLQIGEQAVFSLQFLFRDLIIIFFLTFVFIYDLKYKEILDRVSTIPALLLFSISLLLGWQTWQSMNIGMLIGAGFFFLQFVISKGKWIGGGDIRLGLFMGVILGWPYIIVALMLAYVAGALGSILLVLLKKKNWASETPFGTYLALATVVVMFLGESIITWYLTLL